MIFPSRLCSILGIPALLWLLDYFFECVEEFTWSRNAAEMIRLENLGGLDPRCASIR